MKITVVNGTQKQGVTWRLKEMFLEPLRDRAMITEYYLPKDCPAFCTGCMNCFLEGEHTCKDAVSVQKIERSLLEADLLVMTSPAYVFHVTGAMKAFLDHLAYRWMPHRPAPEMFSKRAVILTQCLGAGAKSAAEDIRHSLSWWGISDIRMFSGNLMEDVAWDKLSKKKQEGLKRKIGKLAEKCAHVDYHKPARTGVAAKSKFFFCRMIQKTVSKSHPDGLDVKYWAERGWLGAVRPWQEIKTALPSK